MNYLFLLKRFEIWLLLGVVVALLIFAFQPMETPEDSGEPSSGVVEKVVSTEPDVAESSVAEEKEQDSLRVTKVEVESTKEGQVVEVTLLARAKQDEAVEVNDRTLRVATAEGIPVPRFFAPFQSVQTVSSEEMSIVTVKLWLAGAADVLWLDFQGERAKAELPTES